MVQNGQLESLKKQVLEIRDRYPKLSLDHAFIVWFFLRFIADNERSAVEALAGGPKDKGADAEYVDHDSRTVFILQGKYRQTLYPPSEKRSDILALADLGRVLLLDDRSQFDRMVQDANATVQHALEKAHEALHERNYRLHLQFVTTGKVGKANKDDAALRIEEWDNASFEVFGRSDLVRLMLDFDYGVFPVPAVHLPIYGDQLFHRFDEDTGISSWVFTMLGRDLGKLYNDVGDRLFARNIRGYQGKTEVNNSIETTLEKEEESFWYYNNGVTIICDEAKEITERGIKKLLVANAQIINGQQTTRILAEHTDKLATILVKVIAVPRESKTEQTRYAHLLGQIVTATNWQNFISQSDLKSNDTVQVRLDREFRKFGYQYLRKRQTKYEARRLAIDSSYHFVKKEELARYVAACLLDPYEVRLGRDRLFEDDLYPIIFNDRPAAEYLTFYRLGRIVSYFSRGDIRRGYAKWLVLNFIWSQIGDSLTPRGLRDNFRYIAERESSYERQFRPLYSAIRSVYSATMAFFRSNRKTKEGILDESTFFKHKNRHKEFLRYWNSSRNTKRGEVGKQLQRFVRHLQSISRTAKSISRSKAARKAWRTRKSRAR